MKYIIMRAENPEELAEAVNKGLALGFRLYGSPSVTCYSYYDQREGYTECEYTYIQAMLNKDEE